MDKYDLKEEVIGCKETIDIQDEISNVITGFNDSTKQLHNYLKNSINQAINIDIIVSFVMESGVRMLIDDLNAAVNRGVKVRLLTGNYLGITQPSALYLLKSELGDSLDLRMFDQEKRSFHPKAYIFHYENKDEIYVGSSNISRSALTSGVEWNYRFDNQMNPKDYEQFFITFEDLFRSHSIIMDDEELNKYSKEWKKPTAIGQLQKYDLVRDENNHEVIFPRGAQIEALYSLNKIREEGANKGLVFAATGIGKTYLAAFDSIRYKRVLFVAHREEILKQAADSFMKVRKTSNVGFFNSDYKDTKADLVFASVASLGKSDYLNQNYFEPDDFDYIVIDEFHHAINDGYVRIMNYFKPSFMLGLTATPDRMDGRDIYKLCDYIVPYQISLVDAINKGMLVPFHYYGIYDETVDYSKISRTNGKYNGKELNQKLLVKNRYDLIYKYYSKYNSKCALGFCSSRVHAERMAKEFNKRNVPAAAVYSGSGGENSIERSQAISLLRTGELKVVFSVDMFNEGVDVPGVDMVMFLRPTESPVVYMQQLGRGLRLFENKKYLNVLDFIGNYENSGKAPFLLSGRSYSKNILIKRDYQSFEFPVGCIVDFDMRLIDMFESMAKRKRVVRDLIDEEYFRVKDELEGKVPTRMELFTLMDDDVYDLCLKNSKENPFRQYFKYLDRLNQLNANEKSMIDTKADEFLNVIETTTMSKSYKMPLLKAFYNNGVIKMEIDEDDIYRSFFDFYHDGINGKDLAKDKSTSNYKNWTKKDYVAKARQMPVKFLLKSGKGYFVEKPPAELALNDDLAEYINLEEFILHMNDIINYRITDYYRRRYKESIL